MNNMKSIIHGLYPEDIERQSLAGERFKIAFNMHRIVKTKKLHDSFDWYDKRQYLTKRKKLKEDSMIGKKCWS